MLNQVLWFDWNALFSSRPAFVVLSRGAAVRDGRRPPRSGAARVLSYGFQKWVTPDMEASAARMVKEDLTAEDFKGQHIPDPKLEPGERVVSVRVNGVDKLMLIHVEDKHGFFATDYGVRTFKRWAEDDEDEQVLRTRGSMQVDGIDELKVSDIVGVPSS